MDVNINGSLIQIIRDDGTEIIINGSNVVDETSIRWEQYNTAPNAPSSNPYQRPTPTSVSRYKIVIHFNDNRWEQIELADVDNQPGWTDDLAGAQQAVSDLSAALVAGGGGGGGSPAGNPDEIQFNNSGAFGASPDLTWTGSLRIGADSGAGEIIFGANSGDTGTIESAGSLQFVTPYSPNLLITENGAWDFGGDIGESGKFLMSGGDFATPQWFQPQDNQIAVVSGDKAVVVCGSIPYPHVLQYSGLVNGRPSYGGGAALLRWDGVDEWEVFNVSANARLYSAAQNVATPDLITAAWTVVNPGIAPAPGPILVYSETDNVADLLDELAGKQAISTNYRVYRALVSQAGINDPTATVLQDDFGGLTFQYGTVGVYRVLPAVPGQFVAGRTFLKTSGFLEPTCVDTVYLEYRNSNELRIYTNRAGGPDDGLLADTSIEIIVYPE